MLKQRAQTTKEYKNSPYTYACSPWTSANSRHKPVRPVPKTGHTGSTKTGLAGYQNLSDRFGTVDHTPQKPQMQKKCTSSPLTLRISSRDAMQLFSTFLSPPCCQCMNQGSNFKTYNLELSNIQNSTQDATHSQMSKLNTLRLCNDINFMITKFHNHWTTVLIIRPSQPPTST
jgi:hypothetical protein